MICSHCGESLDGRVEVWIEVEYGGGVKKSFCCGCWEKARRQAEQAGKWNRRRKGKK